MVGPLQQVPDGFTPLLVAVDKFSKWIEARPIVNVHSEEVVSFFTDIIYPFVGVLDRQPTTGSTRSR
jgi:hypothetical protein